MCFFSLSKATRVSRYTSLRCGKLILEWRTLRSPGRHAAVVTQTIESKTSFVWFQEPITVALSGM